MAEVYRYVNMNPFPICLPDGRGGQVMFRPNEGTTKQWYSRMCGEKALTRVSVTGTAPVRSAKPVPTVEVTNLKINSIVDTKLSVPAQPKKAQLAFTSIETAQFSVNRGIYFCKLCDIFRTGSSESMRMHLDQFHASKAIVTKVEPKIGESEGEGEKLVVTSLKSTSQLTSNKGDEEETVRTSLNATTPQHKDVLKAPELTVQCVPDPVFECEVPGCGKAFKSKKALVMHKTRIHKEA